jgi:hypothetical protein
MNELEPTSSPEIPPTHRMSNATRLLVTNKRSRWVMAAAVIALAAGCSTSASPAASSAAVTSAPPPVASSTASTAPSTAASSAPASGRPGPGGGAAGGGGSNARSGPAEGGAAGTVGTVSASGFTMTTVTGQQVTVNEAATTTYKNGTSSIAASAITQGESVLVLGTTNSTTITAAQITVQPNDDVSAVASAAGVVPFQQGAPSATKQVGQIPANYVEGQGTIVSGTTADQATEAALAAYPGAVVDRVVQLSGGDYEVHYIGVNWPHHVFVSPTFQVLGAG